MSKKCNSPGEFPGSVGFFAVFFRKKNRKMEQSGSHYYCKLTAAQLYKNLMKKVTFYQKNVKCLP